MIIWRMIAVMLTLALVQLGFLAAWRPLDIVPNLLLAATVALALRGNARPVMLAAAVCGLCLDLNSGAYFGLWTLTLPLAAFGAKLLQRTGLIGNDVATGLIIVMGATLTSGAIIIAGMIGILRDWPIGLLVGRLGAELAVNGLFFGAFWLPARWMVVPKDTLPGVRRR